ncbi:glutamate receptor ionotropic, kainate 2-like isoform X3 [Homarus americanus]|uniref:glutamate receptor ionotropic, kainate 2-like isoform X3 n=1 Tax=Homarus americanus TaxID=6706 RepID=UPI001C459823|nr:glutamate receptor ionotropic, kainate 2-like isoform X3 [Homarus americanus]
MMKQGSMLKPISDSSRILIATWWLFIMIVTSFYTANLTAFLTFNGLKLPIEKVEDLENLPGVSWLAFRDGALVEVITTHPKLKVLRDLQAKGRGRFINSRAEAVALVRTNEYVYIDDMQVLEYLIQEDFKTQRRKEANETCSFYTTTLTSDKGFTFWYGYGFRKDSEYSDLFNGFFRRLSFFGILNFLHDNVTSNSPVCTLPKGFKDRRLQNKDFYTTYVLGSAGVLAALTALICEFVCRKSRRTGRNMTPPTTTFTGRMGSTLGFGGSSQGVQDLNWSSNLPPLPSMRPRTPFEVRYPHYNNRMSSSNTPADGRNSKNVQMTISARQQQQHQQQQQQQRPRREKQHSHRTGNMFLETQRSPYIIEVVW